jgi:hypothetical protein
MKAMRHRLDNVKAREAANNPVWYDCQRGGYNIYPHKLARSSGPLRFFGELKINDEFVANQWGHGINSEFVKRDKRSAIDLAVFKSCGGHQRGWSNFRTQFGQRDIVMLRIKKPVKKVVTLADRLQYVLNHEKERL